MLFLLDRAKLTESPTRQRCPARAGDLFSAMAAKVGTIEHVAVELGTKSIELNECAVSIVQFIQVVKTRMKPATVQPRYYIQRLIV